MSRKFTEILNEKTVNESVSMPRFDKEAAYDHPDAIATSKNGLSHRYYNHDSDEEGGVHATVTPTHLHLRARVDGYRGKSADFTHEEVHHMVHEGGEVNGWKYHKQMGDHRGSAGFIHGGEMKDNLSNAHHLSPAANRHVRKLGKTYKFSAKTLANFGPR
jgi:hypothetical protein